MERSSKRPLFCIIDASSFIFRAYYAVRPLSNKNGLPTNAIFGFANMIVKVLEDFAPEYIAVVYDTKHPSFRKELYPEYKANRGAMPEDLVPQIPYIKKFIEALGLPNFERPGFEADDVIATLADGAARKSGEADVCIITSDKDLMQLVEDHVFIFDTMKDLRYDAKQVEEKLGVPPKQVADFLGLVGDSSDNIPGVEGVGPKTAIGLLQEFGSMDGIYENLALVKKEAQREKLEKCREMAFLSKDLATVRRNLDINSDWHNFHCEPTLGPALVELLAEVEFSAVLKRLEKWRSGEGTNVTVKNEAAPTSVAAEEVNTNDLVKATGAKYHSLRSMAELKKVFAENASKSFVALDTETTGLSVRDDAIVGFSFCVDDKNAYYVSLAHVDEAGKKNAQQIPVADALKVLGDFLVGKKIVGQNLKFDSNIFRAQGVDLSKAQISFDTMVASYVLEAQDRHNLDALANKYLNHKNISFDDLCGTGKKQILFSQVPIEKASEYAAEDAHVAYLLWKILEQKVQAVPSLEKVFTAIDMPLVKVLADIEWEGIAINVDHLAKLSQEFTLELHSLEKKAYEMAGEEFNLASPKQLQKILFEKLKMPTFKKTKTGFSTDVEVLEKLAMHHALPAVILEHRELSKLLGT